jgi:hypothetical protein
MRDAAFLAGLVNRARRGMTVTTGGDVPLGDWGQRGRAGLRPRYEVLHPSRHWATAVACALRSRDGNC